MADAPGNAAATHVNARLAKVGLILKDCLL